MIASTSWADFVIVYPTAGLRFREFRTTPRAAP